MDKTTCFVSNFYFKVNTFLQKLYFYDILKKCDKD